jgi:hypothetical protein
MTSPWEATLGARAEKLHPRLREYFGPIPEGSTGVGTGVFDVVGTPRIALWPALAVLGREGVLFAAWRRKVPFTVLNHPVTDYDGNPAILAHRVFHFRFGDRRMEDALTATGRGLVDHLGYGRRFLVKFEARVVSGHLELRSTSVAVRLGRLHVPIPGRFAPKVRLVERFDDEDERQHVSLTLDSPQFGRLYEYSGSFAYEVLPGEQHG